MKKIAVLSPYYIPGLGYQEVFVSQTLADLECEVKVFSTSCTPTNMIAYENDFTENRENISVERTKPIIRYRETFFPNAMKIASNIVEYKPNIIVAFNVPSGFIHSTLEKVKKKLKIPVVVFFSDLHEYKKKSSPIVRLLQILVAVILQKNSWYRKVFEHASLLVCNTPETKTILSDIATKQEHKDKMWQEVLGVNSQNFRCDANVRQLKRRELNVGDDEILLMTITKIIPRKGIELLMENAEKLHKKNPRIRYMIVGGLEDEYQRELEGKARDMSVPITLVARQPKSSLNALYNAADLTLWHFATHSIQESLFTGVAALLPKNEGVSHLLKNDNMGKYFTSIDEVTSEDISRLASIDNRMKRVGDASFLSYESILQEIFSKVGLKL